MTRILTLAAMGFLVAVTLGLTGCHTTPPEPSLSALPDLPQEWDAPPKSLPDIPACEKQRTPREQITCRADYDGAVRSMYVVEADRRVAVAGWVRVVRARAARAGL